MKSGVRLIGIGMKKHIPSHIKIGSHHALISYEGQPLNCFRCNEKGHQTDEYPRKRIPGSHIDHDKNSWANMVKRSSSSAMSSGCSDITEALTSINAKTQSYTVLTTRSSESYENNKSNENNK